MTKTCPQSPNNEQHQTERIPGSQPDFYINDEPRFVSDKLQCKYCQKPIIAISDVQTKESVQKDREHMESIDLIGRSFESKQEYKSFIS